MTNAFDTIGWSDDFSGSVRLPFQTLVLRALNGDAKLKGVKPEARYFGGWAYGAENAEQLIGSGDFASNPGWESYEATGANGEYRECAHRLAHLSVIKGRMRWVDGAGAFDTKYFTGARMHVQYLCGLFTVNQGGVQFNGMATVTAKGMQAKHLQDAISAWENAIRAAKAGTDAGRLPRPAWIITIGTFGEKPEFTLVGKQAQSAITPLRAKLPQKEGEFDKRIVDNGTLEYMAGKYALANDWLNAWKTGKGQPVAAITPEDADMRTEYVEQPF